MPQAGEVGKASRVRRMEGRADAGQALQQAPQEQIRRHRAPNGRTRRRERARRNARKQVIEPHALFPKLREDEQRKNLGHA